MPALDKASAKSAINLLINELLMQRNNLLPLVCFSVHFMSKDVDLICTFSRQAFP